MEDKDIMLTTRAQSRIDGRNVWWYEINSIIGDFHVIDYEAKGLEIKRKVYLYSAQEAEKKYTRTCLDMIKGKI